ncbi:MAG: glycosyltransferase family 4 protein [Candidatus Asgardarchaeia archaeon]
MRILQVTPFFGESYGGTERYSYFLSKKLSELGHKVDVLTSRILPKSLRKTRLNENLSVFRVFTLTNLWDVNPLTFNFPWVLWNSDFYDVIHIHSYLYFTSFQTALAKIYRAFINTKTPPILLQFHGGIGMPEYIGISAYKKAFKRLYDKLMGKLTVYASDALITMSKIEMRDVKSYFKINKKFYILPNAVEDSTLDLKKEYKDEEFFTLIYVGDVEPWKGVLYLIGALKKLVRDIPNIKLIVIGEGSQRFELMKLSRGLPVWFTGFLPHEMVLKEIANANLLILPSLWEGMATVILEAMALMTPVIATNVGATPELIKDGKTGLLIRPKNVKDIRDAILKLYKDPELGFRIAKNAYEKVKNNLVFSKIAKDAIEIYEDAQSL